MTNEEVITYIKQHCYGEWCEDEWREAMDAAIKALEQKPYQDAISRQAAIDALKMDISIIPFAKAREYVRAAIETIYNRLEELPSVQPEIIRCKDCKYFEYDHLYIIRDIPVIGHLVCNKWGNGCRTNENGFCFVGERRTDDDRNG